MNKNCLFLIFSGPAISFAATKAHPIKSHNLPREESVLATASTVLKSPPQILKFLNDPAGEIAVIFPDVALELQKNEHRQKNDLDACQARQAEAKKRGEYGDWNDRCFFETRSALSCPFEALNRDRLRNQAAGYQLTRIQNFRKLLWEGSQITYAFDAYWGYGGNATALKVPLQCQVARWNPRSDLDQENEYRDDPDSFDNVYPRFWKGE